MADHSWDTLVGQLKSHKIGRRTFMQKATAAGFSATAVVGAMVGTRTVATHAQENRTVTFWTTHTEPDLASLQRIVDTYNGTAEGHQVELVQIPPAQVSDTTTLMTAVRGGDGPDAYLLDRFIVAQRANDGLLQDLGEFGGNEYLANYLDFAQAEASYGGSAYALPFDTDARALYYNKTMLFDVGVDPSELDRSNGPVTWERIAEIAAMLDVLDDNDNFTQMGFVPWVNQGWHYTYGFSWGGSFFNADECRVTPDDQPIVDAFTWVRDFCVARDANKVSAFGSPSMQPGFAGQQHPFVLGTLGMQVTGDWQIAQQAQYAPDMDYGITWLPVPASLADSDSDMTGGNSTTWAGGWSIVIPEGAQNAEDAWTFLQYAAGPEGQKIYSEDTSHLPTWSAMLEDPSIFDEEHQFFLELLTTAKNRPPLPVGALYWDELSAAYQAVYLAQDEPADALAQVSEIVNDAMGEFCPI